MGYPALFGEQHPVRVSVITAENPVAGQYSPDHGKQIAALYGDSNHVPISEPLQPEHIQKYMPAQGFLVVGVMGGDKTFNDVASAVIGNVSGDPAASEANRELHAELSKRTLIHPAADGNANLFAKATLGRRYAKRPKRLATAKDVHLGTHHPLEYVVLNGDGEVEDSGIASACIGLKTAAEILARLEAQREQLKEMSRMRRLAREALTTFSGLWNAEPFSAHLTVDYGTEVQPYRNELHNLAGVELIGSRLYGKGGRTRVNVDDTRQQLVVAEHQQGFLPRLNYIRKTLFSLATGRYEIPPFDFTHKKIIVRNTSNQDVRYHIDGTVDDQKVLRPGYTIEILQSPQSVNVPVRDRQYPLARLLGHSRARPKTLPA